MIEKTDGCKYPQMAVVDAVSQLIDESLYAFAHRHGIAQATSDPDEGLAYAKLRLVKALERISGHPGPFFRHWQNGRCGKD